MKKLNLALMFCCVFMTATVFGQQWNGSSSINGDVYRNGEVGIGQSTPTALLHIKSIEQITYGLGGIINSYTPPSLRLERQGSSNSYWDITSEPSVLSFQSGTNINSMVTRLNLGNNTFDYKGNLLKIGTDENRYSLGTAIAPSGNSGHYLAFGVDNSGGSGAWTFTGNSSNNGGTIIHSDNEGNLFFVTRGTGLNNAMSVNETIDNVRLRIHGNGKISIGTGNTTNDTNEDGDDYLLFIKGGTLAEEVAVQTGWADYVFDENYELLPLEAVENHIDIYGHLHNTPSAEELNGKVKLGDATVQQQEKIEEIYLHLIEMNKRMKVLEAENERLKTEIEILKN